MAHVSFVIYSRCFLLLLILTFVIIISQFLSLEKKKQHDAFGSR